ncbi:hypothetical protein AWENTII_005855 [Aspergillus wentii]
MAPQIVDAPPTTFDIETVRPASLDEKKDPIPPYQQDAFGDEEFAEIKYKVLKWWQCGLRT